MEVGGLLATLFASTKKATDDGSWTLTQPFPVRDMPHAQAVAHLRPALMLCSWMPENTDFTSQWRAVPCVEEYLLIGSPDSGLSGRPWETWGQVGHFVLAVENSYCTRCGARRALGETRHD